MRLLVCGGRGFYNDELLRVELDAIAAGDDKIEVVIHGAQKGADRMAGKWAEDRGYPVLPFPADWDRYNSAAGPIRNKQMITEGRPTLVVAFPGNKGTHHMVKAAKAAEIEVREIKHRKV